MRRICLDACVLLAGVVAAGAYSSSTNAAYAQGRGGVNEASGVPTPAAAAVEVMTRGPIHEAFAQPVDSGGTKPLVVSRRPPEAIEEVPPDAKPADANATWIGGYWAWDDDRDDFIWVSGVWRVSPPGQRWVAGYWTEVAGGYRWVPGFWTPAGSQVVAYYPEPPASVEQGPTSNPPSRDSVWISGSWRWTNGRYAWQPGFWAAARPGWIWAPASYHWSPRGWALCDGYWDFPLERRGLAFAPVHFSSAAYHRPGFLYSPSVVIDSSLLTFYLFVRPSYHHYYFGDYYAASYDALGIYPWFAVRSHRSYGYDPLFAYYDWRNRGRDPDWAKNLQNWHAYYRARPDQRLPHDLASAQRIAADAGTRPDRQFLKIADTLQDWRARPETPVPLATVSAEEKTQLRERARLMRQFGTERGRMEAEGIAGAGNEIKAPATLQLPKVARALTEGAPSRLEGGVRQTLKPVMPPPPPSRLETPPGEVRKPAAPPQSPRGEGAPRGRGPQEKLPPEAEPEKPSEAKPQKPPEKEPEKPSSPPGRVGKGDGD